MSTHSRVDIETKLAIWQLIFEFYKSFRTDDGGLNYIHRKISMMLFVLSIKLSPSCQQTVSSLLIQLKWNSLRKWKCDKMIWWNLEFLISRENASYVVEKQKCHHAWAEFHTWERQQNKLTLVYIYGQHNTTKKGCWQNKNGMIFIFSFNRKYICFQKLANSHTKSSRILCNSDEKWFFLISKVMSMLWSMWNKCERFLRLFVLEPFNVTFSLSDLKRFPKTIYVCLDGKLSKNKQKLNREYRAARPKPANRTLTCLSFVFVCFSISLDSLLVHNILFFSFVLFCLIILTRPIPCSLIFQAVSLLIVSRIYWVATTLCGFHTYEILYCSQLVKMPPKWKHFQFGKVQRTSPTWAPRERARARSSSRNQFVVFN